MRTLSATPSATDGEEAGRLASHRHHCDLARGRWARQGDAAAALAGLLLGHVVTVLTVVVVLAVGIAWLVG
jgi:hypothetical protein